MEDNYHGINTDEDEEPFGNDEDFPPQSEANDPLLLIDQEKYPIINLLSNSDESNIMKYYEICQCQDVFYNKFIHGVNFLCIHKILKSIYSSEEFNEFKNANSIDIENCDKNELQIEESSLIEIKKKKASKPKLKVKVNNDNLAYWLRNCTNSIQVILKTRYYETVNEIFFIYEKIGDRTILICNDNFEKYLSDIYSTSAEMIENKISWISNFRIF